MEVTFNDIQQQYMKAVTNDSGLFELLPLDQLKQPIGGTSSTEKQHAYEGGGQMDFNAEETPVLTTEQKLRESLSKSD